MLPLGGFTEIPDLFQSDEKQNNINNTTVSTVQQQLKTDLT